MKLSLLIVFLLSYQSISSGNDLHEGENRFILDAVVRQLFEMFRNIIRNGSEEKNVPVLDPFKIDEYSFNTQGSLLSANLNLTQGKLIGLGNFDLQQFNFSRKEISVEVKMYFPTFVLTSEYYELEGAFFNLLYLAGQGKIHIEFNDIFVLGKVYLKQSPSGRSILVKKFENMQFTINNVKSETQFDKNIDDIVNRIIEDVAAANLTKFSKLICKMYGDDLAELMNKILDKFENWNLIAAIL